MEVWLGLGLEVWLGLELGSGLVLVLGLGLGSRLRSTDLGGEVFEEV